MRILMGRECGDGSQHGARKDMRWSGGMKENGAQPARAGLGRKSGITGSGGTVQKPRSSQNQIKVNGGGQECPPHTLPVQFPYSTLCLPNALACYAFDII